MVIFCTSGNKNDVTSSATISSDWSLVRLQKLIIKDTSKVFRGQDYCEPSSDINMHLIEKKHKNPKQKYIWNYKLPFVNFWRRKEIIRFNTKVEENLKLEQTETEILTFFALSSPTLPRKIRNTLISSSLNHNIVSATVKVPLTFSPCRKQFGWSSLLGLGFLYEPEKVGIVL